MHLLRDCWDWRVEMQSPAITIGVFADEAAILVAVVDFVRKVLYFRRIVPEEVGWYDPDISGSVRNDWHPMCVFLEMVAHAFLR